jgi:hypothetical protein
MLLHDVSITKTSYLLGIKPMEKKRCRYSTDPECLNLGALMNTVMFCEPANEMYDDDDSNNNKVDSPLTCMCRTAELQQLADRITCPGGLFMESLTVDP